MAEDLDADPVTARPAGGPAGARPPQPRGARWQFGRLAMGLLVVTVASGVALVPLYDPARPLESMEAIHAGLPWAWMLRGLHWFAAQGLFLAAIGHVVEVVWLRAEERLAPAVWWRSVTTLAVLVPAMLSGFVLRGDADAVAAHGIWRGLTGSIPGLGPTLARLFCGEGPSALAVVATHHAGTFTLALWLLSSEHGGRLWPDLRAAVLSALAVTVLAAIVPLDLGPPDATGAVLLLGPWYMLGLQGALLDLPVAAGWLGPALLLLLLGLLRHAGSRRAFLLAGVVALVLAYAAFTVRLLAVAAP